MPKSSVSTLEADCLTEIAALCWDGGLAPARAAVAAGVAGGGAAGAA